MGTIPVKMRMIVHLWLEPNPTSYLPSSRQSFFSVSSRHSWSYLLNDHRQLELGSSKIATMGVISAGVVLASMAVFLTLPSIVSMSRRVIPQKHLYLIVDTTRSLHSCAPVCRIDTIPTSQALPTYLGDH